MALITFVEDQTTLTTEPTLFDQWHIEEEVLRQFVVELTSGCWLWIGSLNPAGYGRINSRTLIGRIAAASNGEFRADQDSILVHRYTFWCRHGWLPDEVLDHKEIWCPGRRRNCCNPTHLEPVTSQLNTLRGNYARNYPQDIAPSLFDPEPFESGVVIRGW